MRMGMTTMRTMPGRWGIAATVAALVLSRAPSAEACGGCFVPPAEATVVTDHRMALSVSMEQTILWDQIRYSGDPREFAWVLPVRAGVTIEVSNDEFFSALDASSQPIVYPPRRFGGGGCALTGCAAESSSATDSVSGPGSVQVISESVVGPYEQVTLRATDENALTSWLRKNQFTIPTAFEPTINAYVAEGFDFIALKLRPECGERSMRPVRVVTPGADPSLPLRMVAAGVGAQVGIILYVITEGKYRPQNFPSTTIDDALLRWDRFESRANYEALSQDIMTRGDGRTWIVEYADKPQIPLTGTGWRPPNTAPSLPIAGGVRANPGLSDVYYGLCKSYRGSTVVSATPASSGGATLTPCPRADAGPDATSAPIDSGTDASPGEDAGAADGGLRADGGHEAGAPPSDAAASPSPAPSSSGAGSPEVDCDYLDDLDVALAGLHRENVWVTRLRSVLPTSALLSGDLRLEPSVLPDGRADANPVSNLHWTPYYADEDVPSSSSKSSCAGVWRPHRTFGTWAIGTAAAIFGAAWLRRRGRGRRAR